MRQNESRGLILYFSLNFHKQLKCLNDKARSFQFFDDTFAPCWVTWISVSPFTLPVVEV